MADETLVTDASTDAGQAVEASTVSQESTSQETSQAQQESFVAPDGTFRDGWLDRLPQEFQQDAPTLSRFKSFNDLAKSYLSSRKMMGDMADAVRIPKVPPPNASKESLDNYRKQLTEYRKAIGVPESPDGYKIEPPAKLPDGVQWDKNVAAAFSALAHKHNIPSSAVQEMIAFDIQRQAAMTQRFSKSVSEKIESGRHELQQEWKGDFETNIGLAKEAARASGIKDIEQDPGFTSPGMVKFAAWVGKILQEDRSIRGDSQIASSANGITKAKAIITNRHNGNPEIEELHRRYMNGDSEVRSYVRRLLKTS